MIKTTREIQKQVMDTCAASNKFRLELMPKNGLV